MADKFISINKLYHILDESQHITDVNAMKSLLEDAIAKDVEHVVRCKECYKRGTYCCPMYAISKRQPFVCNDTVYCSYGRREA